jgi:hypothetical protein
MGKKVFLVIVCVLLTVVVLAGCNESYRTKAISTDTTDTTVSSNGGLAVRYGKYLYYINGYAGKDVDNTFGNVQKGAIARVELDAAGVPIKSTNIIIVPKNVYNTTATSGLYISDGYIYYSSPSIDKNSSGEPKTAEMWLMRTKLDGTGTKVVKKFEDYTAVYKVVEGYIIYVLNKELHSINLNSRKFEDTKIDEEVTSYFFSKYKEGQNSFVNSVFYLKASENENDYFNVLWCYRAGGEKKKVIEASAETYDQTALYPAGFSLTLIDAVYVGSGLRLIYTKTDQGTNKTSSGTYSYLFDDSLAFVPQNEVRYSRSTTYKEFTFLNDTTAVVKNGNNVQLLTPGDDLWKAETLIPGSSDITIYRIFETDSEVLVYYMLSNVLYKISVLGRTVADGNVNYNINIRSASIIFDGSYTTGWLTPDLVGNCLYYFNSKVLDNIYYLDLSAVGDRDADSRIPRLLGMVTAEDEVKLLTSS